MAERSHGDTRLAQREQEVAEPFALGDLGIGARQEHREVGQVGPRGPHLLAGDDPLVAVAVGARR